MTRPAKFCAALMLGLLPTFAAAQSASVIGAATNKCLLETPGGENLHVTVKQQSRNSATLIIRKKPGASNATVAAYRACVAANTGARGKLAVAADPVVVPVETVRPVRVYRKQNVNPLCPPYAPVLYRGTIYCIGNQS
ncbi:MAG: hypothetical protein ACE369_15280 [Roseovarius sp.]